KFNTLVIQRSKYRLDSNEPNKQKAVIDLLNTFQKKVTKVEEAEGIERGYIDEESGEFFRDSVTTYTKKFLSDNHPNKGTFSIRFNREEITEENIEELINRNK